MVVIEPGIKDLASHDFSLFFIDEENEAQMILLRIA